MTARARSEGLRGFVFDDSGQDMVEYALLVAAIGFVGLAAWAAIEAALGVSYTGLESAQQELWEPEDPQ